MPVKTDSAFLGRAWITPDDDVVAGAVGTWTITYEVGAYGYDERARTIDDYTGLGQKRPYLAALLSFFLLSLIGIPFTGNVARSLPRSSFQSAERMLNVGSFASICKCRSASERLNIS